MRNEIVLTLLILTCACADVTPAGKKVHLIESHGDRLEFMALADKLSAKFNCRTLGFVDAKTSLFPPSYSVHENEVHAALRNKGAKLGANLIIANFEKKPATGVGLLCDEESIHQMGNSF